MLAQVQFLFIIFFAVCKARKNYNQITFDNRDDFDAFVNKHFEDFGKNFNDDFFDESKPRFNNNLQRHRQALSKYEVGNFLQNVYQGNFVHGQNPFLKRRDAIKVVKNKIMPKKKPNQQQISQGQNLNISKLTFQNINNYRKSRGLQQWQWDDQVYQLCQKHTAYQMSRNTISHDNFSQRLRNYSTKNENVAYFSQSSISEQDAANKFFKQWKNSPGHHRNMIAKNVRFGAVGVSLKGKSYYATMIAVDKQQLIILHNLN